VAGTLFVYAGYGAVGAPSPPTWALLGATGLGVLACELFFPNKAKADPSPPGSCPDDGGGGPGGGGGENGDNGDSDSADSSDPNELLGPGYGDEGWVVGGSTLPYRINFENDETATAAAQRVDIVNRLDDMLDWSTFRATQFGFGDIIVTIPEDAPQFMYETTVQVEALSGKMIDVLFQYELDLDTGVLYIAFQSLDPETQLPPDVFSGFLPPEDETGRGMGFVTYTIKPKSDLQTGDSFTNIARIQFDFGEIIYTNQVDPHDPSQGTDPTKEARVTIDNDAPTSRVTAFDSTEIGSPFTVRWSGDDIGSGISSYDIYVSVDDGEFTKWLEKTTATSAIYTGEIGKTYSFYSIAYDNVGNAETGTKSAEATVKVTSAIRLPEAPENFESPTQASNSITLKWDAQADLTGYELRYREAPEDGEPGDWSAVINITVPTSTGTSVGNLNPNTRYEFELVAVNATVKSTAATVFAMTKDAAVPPANIITNQKGTGYSATVKGVKLDKKVNPPTQTTLTFTWTPSMTGKSSHAETAAILIEMYAPRAKGIKTDGDANRVASGILTLNADGTATWNGSTGVTVTGTAATGFTFKINGLNSGTKYTTLLQAKNKTEQLSKVVKVSASTAKYAAPKGKVDKTATGLGTVTFTWDASKGAPTGTNKGYTVGIFVGDKFFADGANGFPAGIIISVTGNKAVVTGLASQKYTFGVQEYVTVGDDIAKSAIAKISASPAKYVAPKMNTVAAGATSLSVKEASKTNPKPVNTATETYAYAYQFGVYDKTSKTYLWYGIDELPVGFSFTDVDAEKGTATFLKPSGKHVLGVREIVKKTVGDTTTVIAASATVKINVK